MARKSDAKLLDEIEAAAVEANGDVAVALRKCLILGGHIGSPELRTWASQELNGYSETDELPSYRILPALIKIDGGDAAKIVTGQVVSRWELPDFARESIEEQLDMNPSIGKIEETIRQVNREGGDGTIAYSIPGGSDLVAFMNNEARERGDFTSIQRIYKATHVTELVGIVEQVRVRLTELVAEIRAGGMNADGSIDPGVAEQAVSVAVGGSNNRVVVNAGQSTASQVRNVSHQDSDGWGWKAWAILIGVVTIAGFIVTLVLI